MPDGQDAQGGRDMQMNMRRRAAVFLSTLLVMCSVWSAPSTSDAAEEAMRVEKFGLKEVKAADTALYIQQLETERAKARANAALAEANIRQAELASRNLASDFEIRKNLYEAQPRYNLAIFLMVMIVVAAGLWFSFLQFTAERRSGADLLRVMREMAKLPADDPARAVLAARLDAAGNKSQQSFEAGPIKISSNVVGLIVLAMSLAFFYLYLDRVYTIHDGSAASAKPPLAAALKQALPSPVK